MSSIKARLMQPTGIEWMDIPFTLAGAVWRNCKIYKTEEYK